MTRYHEDAIRALTIEKDYISDELRTHKQKISNLCRADPYGGPASTLMKEKVLLRRQYNSIDLSIKVLKRDAQYRSEQDWQLEQAEKRRKLEGSYNCLGGC